MQIVGLIIYISRSIARYNNENTNFMFILCMSRLTGYHMYSVFEVSWLDVRVLVVFLSHFDWYILCSWRFVVRRESFGGFSQSLQRVTTRILCLEFRGLAWKCWWFFSVTPDKYWTSMPTLRQRTTASYAVSFAVS